MIDVRDIPKHELLAELYYTAQQKSKGDFKPLTNDQLAEMTCEDTQYFGLLDGRVLEVEINGQTLDPRIYDQNNGEGAAERAVNIIRARQRSG